MSEETAGIKPRKSLAFLTKKVEELRADNKRLKVDLDITSRELLNARLFIEKLSDPVFLKTQIAKFYKK